MRALTYRFKSQEQDTEIFFIIDQVQSSVGNEG